MLSALSARFAKRRGGAAGVDPFALLLSAMALVFAMHAEGGRFSWVAIALLSLALGLAALALANVVERMLIGLLPRADRATRLRALFVVAIVACISTQIFSGSPLARWREPEDDTILRCGLVLLGALGVACAQRADRPRMLAFILVLLTYAVLGAHVIRFARLPGIDVYMFHRDGAKALLAGANPYAITYKDVYPPHLSALYYGPGVSVGGRLTYGYPYPPLSLLIATAGEALFAEPRYLHLFAQLSTAAILAHVSPGPIGCLSGALFLLLPHEIHVLELAWTEPLIIALFAGVVLASARAPHLLALSIGLLLSSKQYLVLVLPALVLLFETWPPPKALLQMAAQVLALGLTLTLPFLFWDAHAIVKSLILYQLVQPFRPDALSYLAMVERLTGFALPSAIAFAMSGALGGALLVFAPRTRQGFLLSSALVLCVFFAFNKQAFLNYYTLVAGLLIMAVGLAPESSAARPNPG